MIIFNCNSFLHGAYSIREMFIHLCNAKLIKLQKDKSLGLIQLLDKYSLQDIKSSFKDIYINENGYLCTPEQSKSSYILRYLEYGGEDVRSTHLISSVKNDLYNLFSIERR